MPQRGTLATKPVAEIIEELHHAKGGGRVRFSREGTGASAWSERQGKGGRASHVYKDVWFEKGEIVSSGTNEPREYLGQYLIASGRITERDFIRAYRTQVETKVLFGKVLAMFGLVTEQDVANALRGKTEETIWDVFLWPEGVWELDESATLAGERLPISIYIPELIAEGERRALEWGLIRHTIPDFEFEIEMVPMPAGTTPLAPRDAAIVRELSRQRQPAEAALELRLSPYQFLQRVHELQKRGRLKVKRREPGLPPFQKAQPKPPPPELLGPVDVNAAAFRDRAVPDQVFKTAEGPVAAEELKRRVPALVTTRDELLTLNVDPEEGYLLSRIDGSYDVATVVSLCPFREVVALEKLSALSARGIISLRKA